MDLVGGNMRLSEHERLKKIPTFVRIPYSVDFVEAWLFNNINVYYFVFCTAIIICGLKDRRYLSFSVISMSSAKVLLFLSSSMLLK